MTNKITHVGFSGTREGMNDFQKSHLQHWLTEFMLRSQVAEDVWFHHGGCKGADYEAHHIAHKTGYYTHLHPPLNTFAQAIFPADCDKSDDPYSFSGRNQRIVLATQVLIATPKRSSGGGTWNTIQHAINNNRPRVIIHPNRVEYYGLDSMSTPTSTTTEQRKA